MKKQSNKLINEGETFDLETKKFDEILPHNPTGKKKSSILRGILVLCLVILIFLLLVSASVAWFTYDFIQKFNQTSQTSVEVLTHQINEGIKNSPINENGRVNFLILGLDEIDGRNEGLLTDTIILASWKLSTSELTLLSLPRDLWIDAYKTKINALYYYGEMNPQKTGASFTSEVLKEIFEVNVHHIITLNINTLGELIDLLGGIEIDVPHSFTDEKFPVSGIDITQVSDPELLYETVTFEKGLQHMDGKRALKYIRSRQSIDLTEGTDNARGSRQHQLIQGIIKKMLQKSTLTNPELLAKIYNWYHNHFGESSLTVKELSSIGFKSTKKTPQINSISLPIADKENQGLIINPPIEKYNQWVYEPLEPSFSEIKNFIKENLLF